MKAFFHRRSWKIRCRQFLEIRQNKFFYDMFLLHLSKCSFLVACSALTFISMHFRGFLQISWFTKILSFKLLDKIVGQLVHSPSGGNDPAPFYFWLMEIVPKHSKFLKYFVNDCLKTFFTSFATKRSFTNKQLIVEKSVKLLINAALVPFKED